MGRAAVAILAAAAALAAAAPAHAQTAGTTVRAAGALVEPESYDRAPPGRALTARAALSIAAALPKVRAARDAHPRAYARAYLAAGARWQVSWFLPPTATEPRREEVAQVLIRDRDRRVLEAWTGVQVQWPMARGYPGQFGRAVNAPWVWIGLCVLFVLPFARRPLRLLHLDLAVLLAFSVSYAFFGAAELGVSVPSAYPLLGYLLVRMVLVARRPPAPPPRLLVGPGFMLLGIAFLAAFRVALNVVDGNVIDVGYASVIGADQLTNGGPLYGAFPPDNPHGDTYGPVAYAAYAPFEALLPWGGSWDDLPAAHAAAIAFDLGCAALLLLLGRRLRGRELGLLLAYLWMTYPFTLMVASSGSNDALVTLLVLAALLAASRPAARGALVALAGLTKFAPLALAPLFAAHRPRRLPATGAAFLAVVALALAPFDLSVLWDRTLGFQQDRDSPFSIWGYYALPGALQATAQVAAVAFAFGVAFLRPASGTAALAALAAAVLIALQLAVDHWFYLYLVWFAPLVWVALLGNLSPRAGGSARSSPHAAAPTPGSGPR